MDGSINVQGYLDSVNAPWGQLFYRLVWRHLPCAGQTVLDFGSGFGLTADHLAADNQVIAVEPNPEMIRYRLCNHPYRQIAGGLERLAEIPGNSCDWILCHNVLEYVADRAAVFEQFHRLLKADGRLSIVKHNPAGKIMQKAVFENRVEEAMTLIHHGEAVSANFGVIREYETRELEADLGGRFAIERIYGVRMFFGLQRNELKTQPGWQERLYALESAAEEIPAFRDIAFFHHVILRHT